MKVKLLFEFSELDRRSLPITMKEYAGTELMSYTQMKEWVIKLVEKRCAHARRKFTSQQMELKLAELKVRVEKTKELADGAQTPEDVMGALTEMEATLQKLNELGSPMTKEEILEAADALAEEGAEEGAEETE